MAEMPTAFPVLCISRIGYLNIFRTPDDLERCIDFALKEGFYSDLLLIEITGKSWKVQSAKKIGNVGPFGGYTLSRGRQIRVKLDVTLGHQFDLTQLQERICGAIDQMPHQWDGIEDTEVTKERVRRAAAIPSLIELFDPATSWLTN